MDSVDCFQDAAFSSLEVAHFHRVIDAVGLEVVCFCTGCIGRSGGNAEPVHVAQSALASFRVEARRS